MIDPADTLIVSSNPMKALQRLHDAVDTYLATPNPDTHAALRYAQCVAQIAIHSTRNRTTVDASGDKYEESV